MNQRNCIYNGIFRNTIRSMGLFTLERYSTNRTSRQSNSIVYAGNDEKYFSFLTAEAYMELQKWMQYRKDSGKEIRGNYY